MSARIPGLAKPYCWIQPKGTDEILKRLLEAREYNVDERERENLCSVAYGEIVRLREDAARLDYLEEEANREPLVLHSTTALKASYRGLGLSNTGRTLRQAIDSMRSTWPFPTDTHDDRPDGRPDMHISTGPGDLDLAGRPLKEGR